MSPFLSPMSPFLSPMSPFLSPITLLLVILVLTFEMYSLPVVRWSNGKAPLGKLTSSS
jgi:hypothetical protein